MPQYQDLLHLAVAAAARAGTFIRDAQRPRDPSAWARKGTSDFVTQIDRGAEDLITDHLTTHGPPASVMGEERSPDATTSGLHWVVDPLDGTTNYLHGYPAYAVSIAAVENGRPIVGVVLDVAREVTYTAARGAGAWLGREQLRVSTTAEPRDALIGTGFPFKHLDLLPKYQRQFDVVLRATSGIRRAGSAALDLVDVACGRFDGFWELQLAPWDVAAGTLIVREAGGLVTNAQGSTDVITHGSIVAGNPTMHRWLLECLQHA